jgi:hypothetical protein
VATAILEKVRQALSQIDRPGAFSASGSAPAVLPGLEVKGLGPIGLPLTARTAKELIEHCEQAPHGKGTKTVVDTSVRRVWRMKPGRFALTNLDWKRFLEETVRKVQEELGLESQELQSHLYELLLYEPGSCFLPHRDGEKLDRMVATLVIALPSSHEGGELVVRHEGQERTIDLGSGDTNRFHIHFAAFYADCEHEVRPLRKGYRLCLVYNLTLAKKSKKSLAAPRVAEHIERVTPLVRAWAADDSAWRLVVTLQHQYTQDGLAWDTLKGVDRVTAHVLDEAARQAGCKAYLALLTFWQLSDAEYAGGGGYGYGRRGRWYDEDDDASEYEMGDEIESSLTAQHWIDSQGHGLPVGELSVEEDELLDPEALEDVDPEEEFEGYTGNAGMTLERWYRHAAIFLWPERRHFAVLCGDDSRDAVAVLNQMVGQLRRSKGKPAATLKEQCIELAAAILDNWSARSHHPAQPQDARAGDLLKALGALDDPRLIGKFLGDILVKDSSADPGKSIVPIGQTYGWGTFQQQLLTVMTSTTIETMERNIRLLERICLAKPRKKEGWVDLCTALARAAVTAVETIDRESPANDWRASVVKRAEVLAGLARALIATGQGELLSRVVDHALAEGRRYPLRETHLPALVSLRPWIEKNVQQPFAALARWLDGCHEQLESLTARAPEKPQDFRREAPVTHKCADCAELRRFLEDPREATHRFSVAQDRRSHLENQIHEHKLDLDCRTEERGRPYTLVCTKTTASYQERLKTYRQDLDRLETVRSIRARLPG